MLKINNLYKKYSSSNVNAVENLSLEVKRGEIFGFLGPNGAGKSTTIKSIVGILPFDKGDIYINDISITKNPIEAKKVLGYVSDNHAVFEQLTGREYVNHLANIYDVDITVATQRADKLIERFSLGHAIDIQIKNYSHGMKQKIAVIGALIHEPKVWILDEPLTGLDPQSVYELKEVMRSHAKKGNTVFFSSHLIDLVENLCDRACVIKKGKIEGIYNIPELKKNNKSLEKIFLDIIKS